YKGKKFVIAIGSKPRKLRVLGIEKVEILNNENIFDLENLPKKLLMIGGGPVSIELGQAMQTFGSEVTILQRGNSILNKEDPKAARLLSRALRRDGLKLFLNSEVEKFISANTALARIGKKKKKISFDRVFVGIGREIDFSGLDLEKAGIEARGNKIKADSYLRTTNKKVLLCGDVVGSYFFTHAAELEASLIIRNFFSPLKRKVDYSDFAWVTFSYPQIATFGLTERELKDKGQFFEILQDDFSQADRAIVDDYPESFIKLFVDKRKKLLGGTIIAPNAGEIISEFLLMKKQGLPIEVLLDKIYPYPTAVRINKKLVSNYLSKKLDKKLNRKVLKFLFH
ncbi:MAG: NAD(P)/FAD-dependent oxidoreductase, partial [Candidatus Moranbacteria bacterium]|nr:NAD(P)/FAD-dependent oxidoreductase [Candidatus Moranbacteria bacterium]